ncbi:centrosomal protein of 290 kDa-like isoform X2 [Corythoichthys intestinalis]|uniref:centrosomal protein of 290 kDa-like isoform X2 n=1 Tax=Corythoichthys intestinalis TaxID=161448 RepID=UPI0025A5D741|nr:centrosomal protein of 290 kDa-like isoform X2 [Corythoichthys intestinalis]
MDELFRMPAAVEWDNVKKLDPLTLHESYKDELDSVINLLTSTEEWEVERRTQEDVIHILRVFQALLKMKHQEAALAEELVEAQEKNENAILAKVSRLEEELTYAGTGPDNSFLRNEIRQLKGQLVRKEEMINQLKKEINREKKTTEKLFSRAEAAEEDLKTLKKENTQLQQDIDFYQEELALKESDASKNENAETQRKLISTTRQLTQYMDNLLQAEDEIARLKEDTLRMEKCMMDSTKEMEKMTNEYNQIKMAVHQCDTETDKLRKERDRAQLQIKELTQKINDMMEEDGPIMAAVDAQVDQWKKVLSEKNEEILVYQHMICDVQQKLRMARLDTERNNILSLQQAVEERDGRIEILREQVEQYTIEMKKQTLFMEALKVPKMESATLVHQRKMKELQYKWNAAEVRAAEAEEASKLAQAHAEEKDREIIEVSKRLTEYERGIHGLEEAVSEIRECKIQIRRRDLNLEAVTKEINQAYITMEQLAEENEDFRERLGYEPSQVVDLSRFRRARGLKQRQYKAENQILTKEIERLEEERLEMKKQVRQLAKQTVLPPSILEEDNITNAKKLQPTLTQNSNVPENEEPQLLKPCMPTSDPSDGDKRIPVEISQGELGEDVMIQKREAELHNYQLRSKRLSPTVLVEDNVTHVVKKPPNFTRSSNAHENKAAQVKLLKTHRMPTGDTAEGDKRISVETSQGEFVEDAVMMPKREAELQPKRLSQSVLQKDNVTHVKQPPTLIQNINAHENKEALLKLLKTHHMTFHDTAEEDRSISVVTCQGECGEEAMMMRRKEEGLHRYQLQLKLELLSKEKEALEAAVKDVLEALKAKDTTNIPSLQKLANQDLKVFVTDTLASLQADYTKAIQEKMNIEKESKRTIHTYDQRFQEMKQTCNYLEEKLKEKSSFEADSQAALMLAYKSIKDLQCRLNNKEEVIKKYQNQLIKAGKNQEDLIKSHAEEMKMLYEKLDSNNNLALERLRRKSFPQEAIKNPSITTPLSKHLDHVAELEQMVAEQDVSLASANRKLKMATTELERQKAAMEIQIKKHADEISKLRRAHTVEMEDANFESNDQRSQIVKLKKEIDSLQNELESQKEANVVSASNTLKNVVERQKDKLLYKEKQIKALSKVLLGMRAQVTSAAEQVLTSQTEEKLSIQKLVDKQTKDLKDQVQDLNDQLETVNVASRKNETRLKVQFDNLNKKLQRSLNIQKALRVQLEEKEQAFQELEKQIKSRSDTAQSKEKVEQWEEAKKWQSRLEKVKSVLKDKEQQNYFLSLQLKTIKDLYAKLERERNTVQKKTKAKGFTADPVVEAAQLMTTKQEQSMNVKVCEDKNQSQEETPQTLQTQISTKALEASLRLLQVPKKEAEMPLQSDIEKENLKLGPENVHLHLQLTPANLDLPRFKMDTLNIPESLGAETSLNNVSTINKDNVECEGKPEEIGELHEKMPQSDKDDKVPKNPVQATEAEKGHDPAYWSAFFLKERRTKKSCAKEKSNPNDKDFNFYK